MAEIHNSDTIKRILDDAKIQTSHDEVPKQLASKVVPVLIANPKREINIFGEGTANNAASAAIYTTPTNKDFYLTSATISLIKDVTATSLASWISFTAKGVARRILIITGLSLTVQDRMATITFPNPILLDRGTGVAVNNNTAIAEISVVGGITGYTVED